MIIFKFLTCIQISQDLLLPSQNNSFVDIINDIINQVKANPSQIPMTVLYKRPNDKVIDVFSHTFAL